MNIYLLTDYKGQFGSKENAVPYRSGMDIDILKSEFAKHNINITVLSFYQVDLKKDWSGKCVIYTSSEDDKVTYKSYIEDIIYGLEVAGAILIPKYKFLRAHHNKVFMEILRDRICPDSGGNSLSFGTLEELQKALDEHIIPFPCVIKSANGAMSRGVAKAENRKELINLVKNNYQTNNFKQDFKDQLRAVKYKGYITNSTHRSKFIVQPMIKGLSNDWKVLVFNDKLFCLKRCVKGSDFRASGSHYNYQIGKDAGLTPEMMDYVYGIYKKMNVPMISFDLAFDGTKFYMIEFQILYFGTSVFVKSKQYYQKTENGWILKDKDIHHLEEIYVDSIVQYMKDNLLLHD